MRMVTSLQGITPLSNSRRQTLSTSDVLRKARTAARTSRLLQARAGSASDQNTPGNDSGTAVSDELHLERHPGRLIVTPFVLPSSAMISKHLQGSTTGDSSVVNRAISTPQSKYQSPSYDCLCPMIGPLHLIMIVNCIEYYEMWIEGTPVKLRTFWGFSILA